MFGLFLLRLLDSKNAQKVSSESHKTCAADYNTVENSNSSQSTPLHGQNSFDLPSLIFAKETPSCGPLSNCESTNYRHSDILPLNISSSICETIEIFARGLSA